MPRLAGALQLGRLRAERTLRHRRGRRGRLRHGGVAAGPAGHPHGDRLAGLGGVHQGRGLGGALDRLGAGVPLVAQRHRRRRPRARFGGQGRADLGGARDGRGVAGEQLRHGAGRRRGAGHRVVAGLGAAHGNLEREPRVVVGDRIGGLGGAVDLGGAAVPLVGQRHRRRCPRARTRAQCLPDRGLAGQLRRGGGRQVEQRHGGCGGRGAHRGGVQALDARHLDAEGRPCVGDSECVGRLRCAVDCLGAPVPLVAQAHRARAPGARRSGQRLAHDGLAAHLRRGRLQGHEQRGPGVVVGGAGDRTSGVGLKVLDRGSGVGGVAGRTGGDIAVGLQQGVQCAHRAALGAGRDLGGQRGQGDRAGLTVGFEPLGLLELLHRRDRRRVVLAGGCHGVAGCAQQVLGGGHVGARVARTEHEAERHHVVVAQVVGVDQLGQLIGVVGGLLGLLDLGDGLDVGRNVVDHRAGGAVGRVFRHGHRVRGERIGHRGVVRVGGARHRHAARLERAGGRRADAVAAGQHELRLPA